MKTFQYKFTILSFKIYFMYSTKNLQFKVFNGMAWHINVILIKSAVVLNVS